MGGAPVVAGARGPAGEVKKKLKHVGKDKNKKLPWPDVKSKVKFGALLKKNKKDKKDKKDKQKAKEGAPVVAGARGPAGEVKKKLKHGGKDKKLPWPDAIKGNDKFKS